MLPQPPNTIVDDPYAKKKKKAQMKLKMKAKYKTWPILERSFHKYTIFLHFQKYLSKSIFAYFPKAFPKLKNIL